MDKHTKGPWQSSTVKGDVVVHGPDGDCIAWCNGIRVDNEANAKLIAAAPEMLDALRQLSILINAGGNFQLGPKGRHFTLPQSLDKLIAKAEGR